jgi:hypothetical protein
LNAVQPDELVHPSTLDCCLAVQFQAKFDKERNSSFKVVDDDAHMVHPLNRMVVLLIRSAACRGHWCIQDGASATFSTPETC